MNTVNPFVSFMQSASGRWLRMLVGLALVITGIWPIGGTWGAVVAVVGLIPFIAGALGICLLAPLFGYTLDGKPHTPHTPRVPHA